jgi:hypothetical protein
VRIVRLVSIFSGARPAAKAGAPIVQSVLWVQGRAGYATVTVKTRKSLKKGQEENRVHLALLNFNSGMRASELIAILQDLFA